MKDSSKNKEDFYSTIVKPAESFPGFFIQHFAMAVKRVEGKFVNGRHIILWCHVLQSNKKTLLVSARKHLKSTVALGFLCWIIYRALYRAEKPYTEWLYMCYKEDVAEYQLKRATRYIEAMPELFGDAEKVNEAASILNYRRGPNVFICEPAGILAFKRGRHPDGMICDDILKDPTNPKMPLTVLKLIERTFNEEIDAMPKERLHVFGTPQDDADIFTQIEKRSDYWAKRFPAIQNEANKTVLWPQEYPFEKLISIRSNIGEKSFNKEYLCRPSRGEDSFFKGKVLDTIIKPRLKQYTIDKWPKNLRQETFAGFDIGKKAHPSHLCILAESRKRVMVPTGRNGEYQPEPLLVQVHSKWMDGWDYKDQLEYLQLACERFKVGKLFFDNTRGEFESYSERGELPASMEPFIFTMRSKGEIATKLDEKVTTKTLWLLDEERQRRQLLSVDNDFKAVQTNDGHGDCFFSLALAIRAWMEGKGVLAWDLSGT